MDAQVPRNNTVQRVNSRRPYRPRQPYPGQPSQNDVIKQLARQICANIFPEEPERKRMLEAVQRGKAEQKPAKRPRQNFQQRPTNQNGIQQKQKAITVRDLVYMMPVDYGAVVICNPDKAVCRFRAKKENEIEKIKTIAKPRHTTPCHTLILTNEFDQPNDLERLLDQFEQ